MIFQYNNFKILEINGSDSKFFLQGLVTSNLNNLSNVNNFLLTAFVNLKGKIISLSFLKFISKEKILLSVEEKISNNLLEWLKIYGIFSKVNFNYNQKYRLFFVKSNFLNHNILIKDSLQSTVSFKYIQKENIFNKLPIINYHNFEKFFPAELNLDKFDKLICYNKGCYIGQEIIARMHYKSKIKNKLSIFKSKFNINDFYLKDINGIYIGSIINKTFINNQYYMLITLYKNNNKEKYQLNNNKIINKCQTND